MVLVVASPVGVTAPEVGPGVTDPEASVELEGVGAGGATGWQVLASTLGHLSAKANLS